MKLVVDWPPLPLSKKMIGFGNELGTTQYHAPYESISLSLYSDINRRGEVLVIVVGKCFNTNDCWRWMKIFMGIKFLNKWLQ